ncbi:pantoate--beta-alanine ligase [Streptomonospora nanhaiensis]|uniref:Pantothenate synthetase n=1 Tax=Streptomonospora nanhaiensis TaxID=1323731 RepID=A0A853BMH5_9ACTN|nr:pantoate--beta-alanine ligase [Streptomonospora nanhaiensis]MBV2361758.1 pantoate--beta-alanine ligase [Streptomonospora nanhaiensis]MBX9391256.1 pantoate--beta-alanine ligase [Streptomonospora nanhaiensis]NYI96423.1 pantoate--beta-alanine ligase [Streptomonospora nanhaiensis]
MSHPIPAPALARTPEELGRLRSRLGRVALVPTMGALHNGHRSLIAAAREHADAVVVSVFVNPLQFGPGEDYERYPRDLDADLAVCAEEGVALVFAPSVEDMYPGEQIVRVDPGPMGAVLEGASRPGFFGGVLTVVNKLFNLVRPDIAVFGQKDAQQLALVRRMVRDLNMPVTVVAAPTMRDPDNLASSSRNAYLSPEERRSALALSRALLAGADASVTGPVGILSAARAVLDEAAQATPPVSVDYLALVDAGTFTEVAADHRGDAVLLVAAWVGRTRLIDNVPLTL